jgi:hypothetical protein
MGILSFGRARQNLECQFNFKNESSHREMHARSKTYLVSLIHSVNVEGKPCKRPICTASKQAKCLIFMTYHLPDPHKNTSKQPSAINF